MYTPGTVCSRSASVFCSPLYFGTSITDTVPGDSLLSQSGRSASTSIGASFVFPSSAGAAASDAPVSASGWVLSAAAAEVRLFSGTGTDTGCPSAAGEAAAVSAAGFIFLPVCCTAVLLSAGRTAGVAPLAVLPTAGSFLLTDWVGWLSGTAVFGAAVRAFWGLAGPPQYQVTPPFTCHLVLTLPPKDLLTPIQASWLSPSLILLPRDTSYQVSRPSRLSIFCEARTGSAPTSSFIDSGCMA